MKITYQYRSFIWAIITIIFILLWQPTFPELNDLKDKHFQWSAVFILILMFLELPATIIKSSAMYYDKDFDVNLFSEGIHGGLIFFIYLFRLVFVFTSTFIAFAHIFAEFESTKFVGITLAIVIIVKEILSGIFTFKPITKFKPSVYWVWIAEVILLAYSALFLVILQGMFASEDMAGKAGIKFTLKNWHLILFTLGIMGTLIMSTYYGTRLLFWLEEKNNIKTPKDKYYTYLSFFLVLILVIYPIFWI